MCFKALTTSEEETTNPSLNITHSSPQTTSNPITQLEPKQSAFSYIKAPSKETSTSSTLSKDSSSLVQSKSPFTQHVPSSTTKTPLNLNKIIQPLESKKCSSFKEVKVFYYDNTFIEGKKLYSNEQPHSPLSHQQQLEPCNNIQQPIILQSETFRPITKVIHKKSLITNNISCTCSKTKCLKKYCECLANHQYCINCNCVDCHNTPSFQKEKMSDNIDIITCTCTKSNCNKKYCECYKSGKMCNANCRCLNCKNSDCFDINAIEDGEGLKRNDCGNKKRCQLQSKNCFQMERISVLIDCGVVVVDKRIIEDDGGDGVSGKDRKERDVLGNKRERVDCNGNGSLNNKNENGKLIK